MKMARYRIQWFGHSMWKVATESISVITDPFSDIGYPMPENESADYVLSSHSHYDHNNFNLIRGEFRRIDSEGTFDGKEIDIEMIPVWHDTEHGRQRGKNLLMKFEIEGRTFLHCGDLGHALDRDTLERLGTIDVMFVPVGGTYTLDARDALKTVESVNPKIVFPMHYKTPHVRIDIESVEPYLKMTNGFRKVDSNVVILDDGDFSKKQTIILNYMD